MQPPLPLVRIRCVWNASCASLNAFRKLAYYFAFCILHFAFPVRAFSIFSVKEKRFLFSPHRVGIELSSRTVSRKVFSPLQSLTSVFGMGTGGPSAFVTPTSFRVKLFIRSLNIEQQTSISLFRISVNRFCLFFYF